MPVLNRRHDEIPPDAVYVGRPSKWGNPFIVGVDGDRNGCLVQYEEWLMNNPQLLMQFEELRGKTLVCWCTPLPCHAHILMRFLDIDVDWRVVARLKSGDWSFGHAGRHYGNGTEGCPRETEHHHHDEFCSRPTLLELRMAEINPNDFKPRSRR